MPTRLEIADESHRHKAGQGAQSHFKVEIVSARFTGMPRIGRHRLVYSLLNDEFAAGMHALTLRLLSPEEQIPAPADSPPCLGDDD